MFVKKIPNIKFRENLFSNFELYTKLKGTLLQLFTINIIKITPLKEISRGYYFILREKSGGLGFFLIYVGFSNPLLLKAHSPKSSPATGPYCRPLQSYMPNHGSVL
jgi:hypothetical protein